MRLPGTRYQEPGWEEVRKLLGQCSLSVLRAGARPGIEADALDAYVDGMAVELQARGRSPRAEAPGNGYGDTVFELALTLVYELQARRTDWLALCTALPAEAGDTGDAWRAPGQEALLRKKVNDMYAVLRDKVDADNYQAACGRPCSPNRIYAYRMLDTAYGDIARLFGNWRQHRAQVGAILDRDLGADDDNAATPIEVRQLRGIADCRPEWIMRWSAAQEVYGAGPGPLHTRSKRFANLKTSLDKIGAMLREIGEYETLSANRDRDWVQDVDDAALWMEDYWRVLQESEEAATPGPDRILEARQDALDTAFEEAPFDAGAIEPEAPSDPRWPALATAVSLPPDYMRLAAGAEAAGGWVARALASDGLPVRLAVYARLLGPDDEAYPDAWRDPATGALPTMAQLAGLAALSLPTLRKRRDAAIAKLDALNTPDNAGKWEAAR